VGHLHVESTVVPHLLLPDDDLLDRASARISLMWRFWHSLKRLLRTVGLYVFAAAFWVGWFALLTFVYVMIWGPNFD
jgi:hypothetical protein